MGDHLFSIGAHVVLLFIANVFLCFSVFMVFSLILFEIDDLQTPYLAKVSFFTSFRVEHFVSS